MASNGLKLNSQFRLIFTLLRRNLAEMILDDNYSNKRIANYRAGFSFAIPVVIVGAVIGVLGLLTVLFVPVIGGVMAAAGGFIATSSYGFQLDKKRNRCREYTSVFWIKRGTWLNLDTLPDLSILTGKGGFVVRSMSNRATDSTTVNYTVYLLSKTHRTKVMVKKFEDRSLAQEFAEGLAINLNRDLKKYSPAVSAKTMRRR